MTTAPSWTDGSIWHRWDPHIHAPGTLFEDQFKGDWDGYLAAIRAATPPALALGITDYCVLDSYEEFSRRRANAAEPDNLRLVFPNVEFRLTVETAKKRGINLHLLFSPDDPDHISEIRRVLSSLTFEYRGKEYRCESQSLRLLGRAFDPSQTDDRGALREGAKQFKLDPNQLRLLRQRDEWMRMNCLIAVCLNSSDGSSGLSKDHSFLALREEIEALADMLFSSREADRDYWLGKAADHPTEWIENQYGALKPCVHGCDAHSIDQVLAPAGERRCWIRSEVSFSGFKQILLEPGGRVFVGPSPPPGPIASETIRALTVCNAPWLGSNRMTLNPGLVTIIGPKGSGKTALADMIAYSAGCGVSDNSSFLVKAQDLLTAETASIEWLDSTHSDSVVLRNAPNEPPRNPGVRYLSQKFVDRLCTSEGVSSELVAEIESVVFHSIPEEDRLESTNFAELLERRIDHVHRMKRDHLVTVDRLSRSIAIEDGKITRLPAAKKERSELEKKLKALDDEVNKLLPKGNEDVKEGLASIQASISSRSLATQEAQVRKQKTADLAEEHAQLQVTTEQSFTWLRERYTVCGLTEVEWLTLLPQFGTSASESIAAAARRIDWHIASLVSPKQLKQDDLETWPLARLRLEEKALGEKLGLEKNRAKKHQELCKQVSALHATRAKLSGEIRDLEDAPNRRVNSISERRDAYSNVFQTLAREQEILEDLYSPLRSRLTREAGDESRLKFSVNREVDLAAWVRKGETLLDLRRSGAFQGKGALMASARKDLLAAWRSGGADEVTDAMESFIKNHGQGLVAQKKDDKDLKSLGHWLFSTDHVSLEYGITYDGVDISRLSPGMRGIVLLLLYLVVDEWDTRPLVVDQPEENLDPFSINDQLVPYFKSARTRRQIVLVTHNANLVVNADADQVIVAEAIRDSPEGLPRIQYTSGGLEDGRTRKDVCRILEGGERAFIERERRYDLPRSRRNQEKPSGEA